MMSAHNCIKYGPPEDLNKRLNPMKHCKVTYRAIYINSAKDTKMI